MINVYLFTKENCAPCTLMNWFLHNNVVLHMYSMDNPNDFVLDLATKYVVKSAPTAVVENGVGNFLHAKTFENLKELIEAAMTA